MKASVPVSNLGFELPLHSGIPGSLTGKAAVTWLEILTWRNASGECIASEKDAFQSYELFSSWRFDGMSN